MSEPPVYLTREEAAQVFDVSLPTVDRWIKDGGSADGHPFVVEFGGPGRAYKICPDRLKAWRNATAERDAREAEKRKTLLGQLELGLAGGDVDGDDAVLAQLTAKQRSEVYNAEILRMKAGRMRGDLVETARAQHSAEARYKLLGDFLKGLPDLLGRKLNWDAATIETCATAVESMQERLARVMMENRLVGDDTAS